VESKKYTQFNDQLQTMDAYIFATPEKQTELFCHLIARYDITNGSVGSFSVSLSFAIT